MVDLHEVKKGHSDKFAVFWEKIKVYLKESSAVHECRHGEVTCMTKVMSIPTIVLQYFNTSEILPALFMI